MDCACVPYIRDVGWDEIHTCRKAAVFELKVQDICTVCAFVALFGFTLA